MEKYRRSITKLTLCILLISFIPCLYNIYGIAANEGFIFKIHTLILLGLNILVYYTLGYFIKNPKYLFKGNIDDYGNYKAANPSKKMFNFTVDYYYIFRFISIATITYFTFQK